MLVQSEHLYFRNINIDVYGIIVGRVVLPRQRSYMQPVEVNTRLCFTFKVVTKLAKWMFLCFLLFVPLFSLLCWIKQLALEILI